MTDSKDIYIDLPVDDDVLEWFQLQGADYKEQIHAVLRSYYEVHKKT